MNTPATTANQPADGKSPNPRREVVINLVLNVVAPLVVFYGLRAAGVGQWLALALGVRAVWTVTRRRRVDGLAVFTLSILVLSVAVSFITGSPRFLLAKGGWMTAVAGLWMLATLPRTPFYHQAIRSFTTGATRERAEIAWRDSPAFRHMMRVASAIWGVGLVLDAGVRVVLAYALPVDRVPLVSGLQYVAVFVALEVGSQIYLRRAGARVDIETEQGRAIAASSRSTSTAPCSASARLCRRWPRRVAAPSW
ncbi:VC0807 family protein [Nonomuraea aurantiaca]|uniref:VC0807 family protein n=1 Tax=Nonomuraea aurantiaca TaxID=2878562 RepID=UPI001CD97253|nr:VC0807 family protein [Nonomuraea aurantiaca]MCA2223518.1 hypothetical protein [Nonomuraea aurantiaca]